MLDGEGKSYGMILAEPTPVQDILKGRSGMQRATAVGVVGRLEEGRAGPWGVRLSGSDHPAPSQLCDLRLSLNCLELRFSHP